MREARYIKHTHTHGLCLNLEQTAPRDFSQNSDPDMSPSLLTSQLVFLFLSWSFLLFPSTTALPLPFTQSTPKAHACLTLDSPLGIASLKFIGESTCAFHSYPFCAGNPTSLPSSAASETMDLKIASLSCESAGTFRATDSVEEASESQRLRSDLRRSTPIAKHPSDDKRDDVPPQPYPEAIQAGTSDVKLTPWKPSTNSWPPKESDGCGGDGPYYANGNGCIGPARVRDVAAEGFFEAD